MTEQRLSGVWPLIYKVLQLQDCIKHIYIRCPQSYETESLEEHL
jgi:hypothetical protein